MNVESPTEIKAVMPVYSFRGGAPDNVRKDDAASAVASRPTLSAVFVASSPIGIQEYCGRQMFPLLTLFEN